MGESKGFELMQDLASALGGAVGDLYEVVPRLIEKIKEYGEGAYVQPNHTRY